MRHRIIVSVLLLGALVVHPAAAFVVEDIEVQGLQRLEAATLFTYLPVEVGEEFDPARSNELLRALFQTQLFSDVEVSRRDNVLVVKVVERPAITEITFDGLEVINDEDLSTVLENADIAAGRIYNEPLLDRLNNEILQQYYALGRYNANIDIDVEEKSENRVAIHIQISEGDPAEIEQVRIIGNISYTEEDLLDLFVSGPPIWYDIMGGSGQYSKLQLSGDLEKLRTFYLNRGFLNFRINSSQVSISPSRDGIYVTVHITEGQRFVVREVSLSGVFTVPEEDLIEGLTIKAGEYFSRARMLNSSDRLATRLGEDGYAFANVNPVTDLDAEKGEVAINFFIDLGQRVYVRRIDVTGNRTTLDEVLRREMRQMEGGWLSPARLERSKRRIQRLEYIESVEITQTRVAGTSDQVDVKFEVVERLAGNFTAGAGFSSGSGLTLAAGVEQDNFLGSGNRVGIHFDNSETSQRYSFDFFNPYYTLNGVTRGFGFSTRKVDTSEDDNFSEYESRDFLIYLSYGIPISDDSSFNFATRLQRLNLDASQTSSDEIRTFLNSNDGNCMMTSTDSIGRCDSTYDNLTLVGQFSYDTRDRSLFTRDGSLRNITATATVPGSDLTFYTITYKQEEYTALTEDLSFGIKGEVSYGDGYSSTNDLPFFNKFVAGGPRSVRGYEVNTLGPRDSLGDPYGGNLKMIYSMELGFPVPYVNEANLRGLLFLDAGYVYEDFSDFEADLIRGSLGLGFSWLSPLGGVSVSITLPLNEQDEDEPESFQFNLGTL